MSQSEAVNDFTSSLNDLKTTNKANISMLTILADDDKKHAPEITNVIEDRLREAPPVEKLPVLYLIDSIIKNLPETAYKDLFAENIVNNFVSVFAQVDDKVRAAMFKVRQTWSDIFTPKKLFVLDVKVNKIDPKWPIVQLPPDGFARSTPAPQPPHAVPTPPHAVPRPPTSAPSTTEQPPHVTSESIIAKEKELQRLTEQHDRMQREKTRQEQGKDIQQRVGLFIEQLKSVPLPESAQKLLMDMASTTLLTAQEPAQPASTTTSTQVAPRDPRKRQQTQEVQPISSKPPEDVFAQLVQNLQEVARCLKSNEEPKLPADVGGEGSSDSPGEAKRQNKRPLEPRDTSVPPVKNLKSEPDAVPGLPSMEGVEPAASADVSDAEFNAAVAEFRQISTEPPSLPKPAAKPPTSASQPLEPVQPLKPPSTVTFLPPGPGPMPSLPGDFNSKQSSMTEKDQLRLLDEAERQLHSGELTPTQHGDLVDRLTQLYDIQRKIQDAKGTTPESPEGTQEAESSTPAPEQPKAQPVKSSPPAAPSQGLLPTPGSAEDKAGSAALQPSSFPSTAHVVLNGEPIDMTVGGPPRMVFVAGKRRAIRINAQSRQVLMDGRPVYKLNSPLREIMVDNCRCMIFYHGEMQSIWINAVEYRIRVDAPPQTVTVDGQPVELVIDTGAGDILVNGERACAIANLPCDVALPPNGNRYRFSFHAPARQIQIDNQLCEVKLDLPVPAVLINGELRGIRFDGPPRVLLIDDEPYEIHTDTAIQIKPGRDEAPLTVQLGAPAQELIIGEHRYNIGFGTGPVYLMVNNRKIKVELPGNTPEVKLLGLIDTATGQVLSPTVVPPMPPPIPPMPPFGAGAPFPPLPMPPPLPPPGFVPPPMLPPSQMAVSQAQHSGSYAQPTAPVEPIAMPPPPPPPPVASVAPGAVDVSTLISRLMNKGMLPVPSAAPPKPAPAKAEVRETPDLTDFSMDLLKAKYMPEITRLYAGVQCGSCGCRFSSPESSRYRLHLDWHFRVNKREREAVRVLRHRAWFLPVLDWIALEQSADPDQSLGVNESSMMVNVGAEAGGPALSVGHRDAPETSEKEGRPTQLVLAAGDTEGGTAGSNGNAVVSCPAASDTKRDTCVVCGESFETFWNEELDEWHLKDAVCVASKTYHTVCFEDAARASVASTPSSPTFPPKISLDKVANGADHQSEAVEQVKAEPEASGAIPGEAAVSSS